MSHALVERVLLRLEDAEMHEPNAHYRDDYRIAWLITLYAARGESQPHVLASYRVLGLHPEKVWSAIVARRHAQLGRDYDKFFAEEFPAASSPKKPVQSVHLERAKPKEDDRAA